MARVVASPRKRHWCFTSYLVGLDIPDPLVVRYMIYQSEICEETKRPHYQGYIEFYDNVRLTKVKSTIGECHAEPRRGSRTAAREYCRKPESAVPNTVVEFGQWREDTNRKRKLVDLLRSGMSLTELIEEAPDIYVRYHRGLKSLFNLRQEKKAKVRRKVEVVVFVGPTGTGKTTLAAEEPDHYFLPCTERNWFDNYRGQNCLILDDFYGNMKYSKLLRVLDGFELQCEVKTDFIWALWNKVIITSNVEPKNWYKHMNGVLSLALCRRIGEIKFFD